MVELPDKETNCRECGKDILVRRVRRLTGNVCPDCKRANANRNQKAYYWRSQETVTAGQRSRYRNSKGRSATTIRATID